MCLLGISRSCPVLAHAIRIKTYSKSGEEDTWEHKQLDKYIEKRMAISLGLFRRSASRPSRNATSRRSTDISPHSRQVRPLTSFLGIYHCPSHILVVYTKCLSWSHAQGQCKWVRCREDCRKFGRSDFRRGVSSFSWHLQVDSALSLLKYETERGRGCYRILLSAVYNVLCKEDLDLEASTTAKSLEGFRRKSSRMTALRVAY